MINDICFLTEKRHLTMVLVLLELITVRDTGHRAPLFKFLHHRLKWLNFFEVMQSSFECLYLFFLLNCYRRIIPAQISEIDKTLWVCFTVLPIISWVWTTHSEPDGTWGCWVLRYRHTSPDTRETMFINHNYPLANNGILRFPRCLHWDHS